MKSLWKVLVIESFLFLALASLVILFLMFVDIIPVNGLDVIKDLFTDKSEGQYKKYGIIVLFGAIAFILIYSSLLVVFKMLELNNRVIYPITIGSYAIGVSGVVVSLLLLLINF